MKYSISLILLLLLNSCGQSRSGLVFVDKTIQTSQINQVSFAEIKKNILEPNCIGCHTQAETEEGLAKWIFPGVPEKSKLFTRIEDGTMPLGASPLSTADLEFVRQYIEGLSIQQAPKVTFETLKKEILIPSCLGCHAGTNTEEKLMKWININAPMSSRLYLSVKEQRMPKNGPPLSEEKLNLIANYLKNFIKGDAK